MIDFSELFSMQERLLQHVSLEKKRFLYNTINWEDRLLGLYGARGTGKTTMLLQRIRDTKLAPTQALYISADHIRVEAYGLYEIGRDFFQSGGKLLMVDEVHKSPRWAERIKNLYDSFPDSQIVFSGSSTLRLQVGKADLSRRAVYHFLPSLSLREYLLLSCGIEHPGISLEQLLADHGSLAGQVLDAGPILGHFRDFLDHGAYPFFLEGVGSYHERLANVVEKVLYEDIPTATGMRYSGVPVLKKILFEIAGSPPFQLNIERLSSDLGISKPTLYSYLSHLEIAGLIKGVMPEGSGATLTRKPAKLFMDNAGLLTAMGWRLPLDDPRGTLRETFFAGQLRAAGHDVRAAREGDFVVDGRYRFEIGGRRKSHRQLAGHRDGFVVRDDIEIGHAGVLPLWLFGFLY